MGLHRSIRSWIEQIIAMEESAETEQQENEDDKREKKERDRSKVEDMRQKALETMGETSKRKEEHLLNIDNI